MPLVTLLKPLDGHPIGAEVEFDQVDIERLAAQSAVRVGPGFEKPVRPVKSKAAKA